MDLASMLKREDFFPIFFATIKDYYRKVYDAEVNIEFCDKKNCNLVIKPQLSCATSSHLSVEARQFFYSEWNVRDSWIKYVIAKIGAFLLLHSGKSLALYTMSMSPERFVTKDLIIAPNNRSIRFFDYKKNTVGCMIKKGFTNKYFVNQLRFRREHDYPFMVPLISYGDDWFIEPIMKGHALARVTDKKLFKNGLQEALDGICQLAQDTMTIVSGPEYIEGLYKKIEELLDKATEKKKIKCRRQARTIVSNAVAVAIALKKIPLCKSHGDFQTGNIWVDEEKKTWIYDWETVDIRSAWYDSSVLCYSLRRPYGWREFYKNKAPDKMMNCVRENCSDYILYDAMKQVVLLEDMVFYLEDMLELPNEWGTELFEAFIDRILEAGY